MPFKGYVSCIEYEINPYKIIDMEKSLLINITEMLLSLIEPMKYVLCIIS